MLANPVILGTVSAIGGAVLVFLLFPLSSFATIGTFLVVWGFFLIGSCWQLWAAILIGAFFSVSGLLLLVFAHGV